MNKLYNLSFVIGLFFLLVGLLLIGYAFLSSGFAEYKMKVNFFSGLMLLAFGMLMLFLSKTKKE